MNLAINGASIGWLALAYVGLLAFGVGYNWLTTWAEKTGFIRPYTAFFVVGGVVVILTALLPFVGFIETAMIVGGFICAGTPMIVGSMHRHHLQQKAQIEREKKAARDGNNA